MSAPAPISTLESIRRGTIAPETEAAWRGFVELALSLAGQADADPAPLMAERERVRGMALPGEPFTDRALKALLLQAEIVCAAPAKGRAAFLPTLKAVAEQAWRLLGAPPPELRSGACGREEA